jgi:peptide deformylase
MSLLKVARLGHPFIRKKAEPVQLDELKTVSFQTLIDDMIQTMREYEGVGLAAPQIHVSRQIAVIEVCHNNRYPDAPDIPLTVLVNPQLHSFSKKECSSWEGCLSIPDMRGMVPRYQSLVCEAWDRHGNSVCVKARDFFSRIIQHEWDHLQGQVYLDRMPDFQSLTHLAEFTRFWAVRNH